MLTLQRQSDTAQIPEILKNSPNFFDEITKSNSEVYIQILINELFSNYQIKI